MFSRGTERVPSKKCQFIRSNSRQTNVKYSIFLIKTYLKAIEKNKI